MEMAQDSGRADFWDGLYQNGVTPWERIGIGPEVERCIDALPAVSQVLVPGCGSARDVRWLADKGFAVDAIDFSAEAIERARQVLHGSSARLWQADFFALPDSSPYDLIFERAFLCALPPRLRPDYAAKMARLLRPGGLLAGLFYLADTDKGPPFGIAPDALRELLGKDFTLLSSRQVEETLPVFAGREFWMVWQRVAADQGLPGISEE
jgi:SAM-dependent methyltransferase